MLGPCMNSCMRLANEHQPREATPREVMLERTQDRHPWDMVHTLKKRMSHCDAITEQLSDIERDCLHAYGARNTIAYSCTFGAILCLLKSTAKAFGSPPTNPSMIHMSCNLHPAA